jgi:hypothetical protein
MTAYRVVIESKLPEELDQFLTQYVTNWQEIPKRMNYLLRSILHFRLSRHDDEPTCSSWPNKTNDQVRLK